jgi:hypothetical protein
MDNARVPWLAWMSAFLLGCTTHQIDLSRCPSGSPMKGVELYSWTSMGDWTFALVPGTNREKSAEEIRHSSCRLTVDELEQALTRLQKDAVVTWHTRDEEGFSQPPAALADRVVEAGKRHGLVIARTGESAR